MCRTRFGQYQVSSATLGWLGVQVSHIMHVQHTHVCMCVHCVSIYLMHLFPLSSTLSYNATDSGGECGVPFMKRFHMPWSKEDEESNPWWLSIIKFSNLHTKDVHLHHIFSICLPTPWVQVHLFLWKCLLCGNQHWTRLYRWLTAVWVHCKLTYECWPYNSVLGGCGWTQVWVFVWVSLYI